MMVKTQRWKKTANGFRESKHSFEIVIKLRVPTRFFFLLIIIISDRRRNDVTFVWFALVIPASFWYCCIYLKSNVFVIILEGDQRDKPRIKELASLYRQLNVVRSYCHVLCLYILHLCLTEVIVSKVSSTLLNKI